MKSSPWRELYAIEFALRSFCGELKDSRVKWFTETRFTLEEIVPDS